MYVVVGVLNVKAAHHSALSKVTFMAISLICMNLLYKTGSPESTSLLH